MTSTLARNHLDERTTSPMVASAMGKFGDLRFVRALTRTFRREESHMAARIGFLGSRELTLADLAKDKNVQSSIKQAKAFMSVGSGRDGRINDITVVRVSDVRKAPRRK